MRVGVQRGERGAKTTNSTFTDLLLLATYFQKFVALRTKEPKMILFTDEKIEDQH